MPVEVELKARLADVPTVVGRLRALAPGEVSTYRDTYYDFPDQRLTTAGRQELRLRVVDTAYSTRAVWTLRFSK